MKPMKPIDWVIIGACLLIVAALTMDVEPTPARQLTIEAQKCWDAGDRAVYVMADGKYRIRCEP